MGFDGKSRVAVSLVRSFSSKEDLMSTTTTLPLPPPPGTVHWERYTDDDLRLMEFALSAFGWTGREGIERLVHYLGYENEDALLQNWRGDEPDRKQHDDLLSFFLDESGPVLFEEVFPDWRFTRNELRDMPPPNAKYRDWYAYQATLQHERGKVWIRRQRRACANYLGIDESMITDFDVCIRSEKRPEGYLVKIFIPTGEDREQFIEQHDPQTTEG